MLAKFGPKVQEYIQCFSNEGIHDNDILFAMKIESKRLQSSEVLLGVVMQIKGFKVLNITTNSKRLQEFNFVLGEQTQTLLCLESHILQGMALMCAYVTSDMQARGREGRRENKVQFNSATLETEK